ncbi:MAG: secretion system X translation initiation factor [Sulfuricella sp.]|nr:hypothetical protein [Gammaproteobacteria bacterium]
MTWSPKKRWTLLLGLFAISMASVFLVQDENTEVAQTVPAKVAARDGRHSVRKNPDASELQLDKLARTSSREEATDIFSSKSWYVPPPPPKPAPLPPPAAPPLPFVYLGKMLEDGKSLVFLSKKERNLVVKEGDVIDGTYRVESIHPSAMTLTYMPLNMTQILPIGASN